MSGGPAESPDLVPRGRSGQREHFRVHYPTSLRPVFTWEGGRFAVVNVSEGGMLFRVGAERALPVIGDEVEGTVAFRDGEEVAVRGQVVRLEKDEVALRLAAGFPFRIILEQQKLLLRDNRRLLW